MSATKHRIAAVDEFADDGDRVIRQIEGQEIAVFYHDGEFYAIRNYCVHEGGPLAEGSLGKPTVTTDGFDWDVDEECTVVACPWHSWMFDIETGKNISDGNYSVPTYGVEVDGDDVYVIFE